MINKTISKIKLAIFATFLAFILLLALFYFFLIQGIKIEHLSFWPVQIEKLYLKLDKKLIVSIDSITISPKRRKSKVSDIGKDLTFLNLLPKYFQYIDIKNIHYGKNVLHLIFDGKKFLFQLPQARGVMELTYQKEKIFATIHDLSLPSYNFTTHGIATITGQNFTYQGKYDFEGIQGDIHIKKEGEDVYLFLNSLPFSYSNYAKIFTHLPLNRLIKSWSYEKIKARTYQLKYLKGIYNIKKGYDPKRWEGLATAKNVKVHFHPHLHPAFVKKVALHFKNDSLYFHLFKPRYYDIDLSGSKVTIKNLTFRTYIVVFLKTKTAFTKEIKEVLHAYRIDVPITQKSGKVDANVWIRVAFHDFATDVKGEFKTKNSLITLSGIDMQLQDTLFKIENSMLLIKPSLITLPHIVHTKTQGYVDLKRGKGKLDVDILSLKIKKGDFSLVTMKNQKERILVNLHKHLFHLHYLDIDIIFDKKRKIVVKRLENLKPFSPLLQKIALQKGKATILLDKNIKFHATMVCDSHIFFQDDHPIRQFIIDGKIDDSVYIDINHLILFNYFNSRISLFIKNLHIDSSSFFTKPRSSSKIPSLPPIDIELRNIAVYYEKFLFPIQKGTIAITKESIQAKLHYHRGIVDIKKYKNSIVVIAHHLDDAFLNTFLQKKIFDEGTFSLEAMGEVDNLKGKFFIKKSYIKNLKLLNNLFAFLNTIPALATLNNPGFQTKGMFVKNGFIEWYLAKDTLYIPKFELISQSLSLRGVGVVDLSSKTIRLDVELQSFKSLSNIIKHIPIAGYILLGKDGRITTKLKVSGSLENPKIETSLTKETIKLPFQIIKRTFELPFKLFK